MRVLKNPGNPGYRKKNPGKSIDAFNILGELNSLISEEAARAGDRRLSASERKEARRRVNSFISLRDTVLARIEGNIDPSALDYSLREALRDLTAAEVKMVRRMIDEAGGEVSPSQRESIDSAVARDPEIRRLQARVDKATRLEEQTQKLIKAAIRRNHMSMLEWGRGDAQHSQIRAADAAAREELGDETYTPANRELWNRVTEAMKKKYPNGYVPPRLPSKKRDELKMLIEMSHKNTSAKRRREIRNRLETAFKNRLKTKTILAYEKAGGKALTEAQKRRMKRDSSQKMKKLGEPFQVGPGFYGVVKESGDDFAWALIDGRGRIHFSGIVSSKRAASKNIGISFRVLENLVTADESRVGWDELPANDRRWLEANKPKISEKVARLMLKNINKRVKVSKETATWIMKAGKLGSFQRPKTESSERMSVGEERVIRGVDGKYNIHLRRGIRDNYTMWVVSSDGRESQKRRVSGLNKALSRGHSVGGAMVGASKVTKAVSNPGKIRKLNGDARRYFAKQNPSIPREAAEEADIKELAGMFKVPSDPKAAYRYGMYFGIIRGIDTCGVQNFLKRKRIRKRYQEKILQGVLSSSARAGGISKKPPRSEREDITFDGMRI